MAQLIIPCYFGHHFVLAHVELQDGHITVYDTMWHKIHEDTRMDRRWHMSPYIYLLPRLFTIARFNADCPSDAQVVTDPSQIEVNFAASNMVIQQLDSHSCGVYCCMQVERLISGSPTDLEWAQKSVGYYRNKIACSIYQLCN